MSLTFAPETIEFFAYTELGKVEQTITPHQRGRVRFMATHWFARFYQPNGQTNALPGTTVRVVGRQGLTLLVVTADEDWTRSQIPISDHLETNQSGMLQLVQQIGSWLAIGLR